MNRSKTRLGGLAWARMATVVAVIGLCAIAEGPLGARAEESADDGQGVLRLRYDGVKKRVVLTPAEELKVGRIYSHFSPRLNRRVWSYVQSNGQFWDALGEGTTQEGWRLDVQATKEEVLEKLAEDAPELYRKLQEEEGESTIYARLNGDNQWVIAERAKFTTIYNAETGYRWEKHSGQYIPVSSGPGRYRWVLHHGKYASVESLRHAASGVGRIVAPTGGGCNCR